eukprot:CAMPEP_0197055448 /NCGR_PEP_ID=MMETSP1384-20130603/65562_1 /TAXON_ID=29189 /ORGANISM="Ammonia sp." /LENGTH=241 /DNA_ID=CAMNT_0042489031 /DNA_START=33 /DNA_END=758 /DNA_ORIENTATION=-
MSTVATLSSSLAVFLTCLELLYAQGNIRPTPDFGDGRTTTTGFTSTVAAPTPEVTLSGDTCCECLASSRTPGCAADATCEDTICNTIDERCCERGWRQPCVDAALAICSNLETCCGCLNPIQTGGCRNDRECSAIVCGGDQFCCNNQWDSVCVVQATAVCNNEEVPPCCGCTSPTNFNGCLNDAVCEQAICGQDPFCCGEDEDGQGSWDQICVNTAVQVCQGTIPLPGTETTTTTTTEPDN